jgi:predicted enzyme related to lactoylglutathione lyase
VLGDSAAFSSFSADDVAKEVEFYRDTLGVEATPGPEGIAMLRFAGGGRGIIYPKADHVPASFTVLNFPVEDVDAAVADLSSRGVEFERYAGTAMETDANGVFRGGGPLIAWFKDPAGNVLSVIEDVTTDT